MILSHVRVKSVLSFALTSLWSYVQFMNPQFRRLWYERGKIAFLSWLEKDTPHLYLCHRCIKLHTWARLESSTGGGIAQYNKGCECGDDHWGASKTYKAYGLDFHILHLIMNRHFYGEGHGPSLNALCYTAKRGEVTDEEYGVVVDQSWRARFINDELYLEASIQVHQEQGLQRPFIKCLEEGKPRTFHLVCDHIGLHASGCWPTPRSLPGVWHRPGINESFFSVPDMLRSCQTCYTDYLYNVKWNPLDSRGPKGWVVSVTKWHRLGACRVLTIPGPWSGFEVYDCASLDRNKKNAKAGYVYRKWRSQDVGTVKRNRKKTGQALVACFHVGGYWGSGIDSEEDSTGRESDEDSSDVVPGEVSIEAVSGGDSTGGQ